VEAFESEEIEDFCQGSDYDCKLVPEGTLAVPPETSLEQTDWQPDAAPVDAPNAEKPDFSQSELDEIRRRLEGLM
jgi:hypothetical protein